MRRILLSTSTILSLATLLLAGCAAGYDQSAVPGASATLIRTMNRCESALPAKGPQSYSEFTACQLAAERNFAVAVKLKRMDAFDIYAREMQQLGADRDAEHLSTDVVQARTNNIRQDFLAKCDCQVRIVLAKDPRLRGSMQGVFSQPFYQAPTYNGGDAIGQIHGIGY
jgi:hypothetical protein